jgi:hypothetical protein
MSFIGNTPTQQAFVPAIDYFSGNGSTVAFTLSRPVASVAQVRVTVNNVAQNPSTAFTVLNSTITFTGAPSTGASNIYVEYTSPITQVMQPSQATVGTLQLVDAAVTAAKLSSTTGTGAVALASLPSFPTTLGVGGATASASGSGVTFPATQSASSDANTLDDYEEGTWTPGLTFGGGASGMTYTTQLGRYVKIGKQVTIWLYVVLSSKGASTGSAKITGLPFTNASGGDAEGASYIPNYWLNMATSVVPAGYVNASATTIAMINNVAGTGTGGLSNSDFGNSAAFYGCATYSI